LPHSQTDGAFAKHLQGVRRDTAVSGSTAVQWSTDISKQISVCGAPADVAVGSLLGNDALAAMADGKITPREALPALAALALVLAQVATCKPVVLMLYPNPYMGVPDKLPDAADKVRGLNELISSIADVINLSGHNPVMLLDLGTVLRPEHFDGTDIHPNEAGYRAMAAAVMDVIARM